KKQPCTQPYSPKQIIIYCGENDFAADEELKPRQVFKRFKKFYCDIRDYYPGIQVDYISIKLSPSRQHLWTKYLATNQLIKKFMQRKANADYIDITQAMNGADGRIREDLFLEDRLHMKPEGYQIWKNVMLPYLK
ncbi:G-D-S-L family lipolytic protein, partial [Kaistella haifensis]